MRHNFYFGMAQILDETWVKQEKGLPILPIQNPGLWEVVYADAGCMNTKGTSSQSLRKSVDDFCFVLMYCIGKGSTIMYTRTMLVLLAGGIGS